MLELILSVFIKIAWVHDRLTPQTVRPRHIGRPVTFTYYPVDNAEGLEILGTLEMMEGRTMWVSGSAFPVAECVNVRVWRKALERKAE